MDAEHHLVVFSHRGERLATATEPSPSATSTRPAVERTGHRRSRRHGPARDHLGGAGCALSRSLSRGPRIEILWSHDSHTPPFGSAAIAVDLDEDGRPEVLSGERVYDGLSRADETRKPYDRCF